MKMAGVRTASWLLTKKDDPPSDGYVSIARVLPGETWIVVRPEISVNVLLL